MTSLFTGGAARTVLDLVKFLDVSAAKVVNRRGRKPFHGLLFWAAPQAGVCRITLWLGKEPAREKAAGNESGRDFERRDAEAKTGIGLR